MRFERLAVPPILPATDLGGVVTLKHGSWFLLADAFGDVHPDARGLGLYVDDTRLLSRLELRIDGHRPSLLQGTASAGHRGRVHLANPESPAPHAAAGAAPDDRRWLAIERDRVLAAGVRERIRLASYAPGPRRVDVRLDVASDAADMFEVRGYPRARRGSLLPVAIAGDRITFRYVGLDGFERRTFLAFDPAPDAVDANEDHACLGLRWTCELAAGATREIVWRAWSELVPALAGEAPPGITLLFPVPPSINADEGEAAYRAWASGTTRVETDHELVNRIVARSLADLRLLMNDGPAPDERWLAAGVPWFATLFGRDAIITSLQLLAFRPQLAVETLLALAARQATAEDATREAQPGRILHELRVGEMVRTGELPFGPSYGSVDATPLWLVLLSETYRWTGDRDLLDRLWPAALAALEWIDRFGDADGDGFVEYGDPTPGGLVNRGWKDSDDSIRHRDGSLAVPPIRLAEVQGYVYDARRRMAELARVRGDTALADALDRDAQSIRRAFEDRFWVGERGTYAMALAGDGSPADALASHLGHVLWSGVVGEERARSVAERLVGPSLFSGWGVRTYAAGQPGFNPIGYHTGSVWPHDTAIAVAGLKRYGFLAEAERLASAVFDAAGHVPGHRLPELFCGFDRAATGSPVGYPVACSPQAWAAGTPYHLLQTLLGLEAQADRRELLVRAPQLPAGVSRVTLSNVRVGDAAVDLLFHRWRGTTSAEVLRKVGDVSVTIRL